MAGAAGAVPLPMTFPRLVYQMASWKVFINGGWGEGEGTSQFFPIPFSIRPSSGNLLQSPCSCGRIPGAKQFFGGKNSLFTCNESHFEPRARGLSRYSSGTSLRDSSEVQMKQTGSLQITELTPPGPSFMYLDSCNPISPLLPGPRIW